MTILLFSLGLVIVYIARVVTIIFVFSIFFAYLINPVVRFLQCHSLFFKNLRGPHVVEAYLALVILVALVSHGLAPQFHKNPFRLLDVIPAVADRVSTGEIANELGSSLGLTDTQATRIKSFLCPVEHKPRADEEYISESNLEADGTRPNQRLNPPPTSITPKIQRI